MEAQSQTARSDSPKADSGLGVSYTEGLSKQAKLFVAPRHTVDWNDFVNLAPPRSIALDGYVPGRPRFDIRGPYLNLNHHEEVDRLGTRSTCSQVMLNLKQGLTDTFRDQNGPQFNIFVNDPDHDVSLSVWLLRNYARVIGAKSEPLINRLVFAEDMLDATAGAYPFDPDSDLVRDLNWIFDPYNQSRLSGRLYSADGSEIARTIAVVGERISRYSLGSGEQLPLDTSYERLGGGQNWALVCETGMGARTALFQSGVKAFVSVTELGSGVYRYSIGKMSPLIHFPLNQLYDLLNRFEGISDDAIDRWGGGDIIGGSPRLAGSRITPKEMAELITNFLNGLASCSS